jgi:hypothetical protein
MEEVTVPRRVARCQLALALALLLMAACGPTSPTLGLAGLATDQSASVPAKTAAKQVSRSLWGLVPDAPHRKADLTPSMVRGSAVAVSTSTLLAPCAALGRHRQVGLVRHGKFVRARVSRQSGGQICELRVAGQTLQPVKGQRALGSLSRGEPLYVIANRDSSRYALAEVPLSGRRRGARLETGLSLPAGPQSFVLVDRRGHLVGLAVPGRSWSVGPSRRLLASLQPH